MPGPTCAIEHDLTQAIQSGVPILDIIALLQRLRDAGMRREAVYQHHVELRQVTKDEATDDRILEVADVVAGFCAPHVKVWED